VKGPYYAIKMEPGIMITMGGIKIDDHMHCVDKNGDVIPGLYSVGCDAGGLFGESYTLSVPGTANGFAFTSGWLAADDISERVSAGVL
jgi:fumarate reductase flavoprotein subunit